MHQMSDEEYDEDFDDDEQAEVLPAVSASKSNLGETDQLLQGNRQPSRMNQAGGRGQRGVAGRPNSHPKAAKDGKKKIEAYKRANEKLRTELDKCIDSQYRVRELEDELKSTKEEFRKMQLQNKKLEKMLDKPVRDQAEDDSGQVERVKVLMNDLRLLQDKTRKYKQRSQDAERSSQRLTVELGAAKTQSAKQLGQIKQLRKSGMDNNTRKQLESQLESANKRAESSARELHMCNKKHSSELKKYRNDAIGADKDGERMRDRLERAESELKEVQMEARILSLKLKNERRDYKAKAHRVKPIDEEDSRSVAMTEDTEPLHSHRTVASSVSKAPTVMSTASKAPPTAMSALEKSVLQQVQREPTPPAPKDDLTELQNKMDALRKRQAKVAEDQASKADAASEEAEQLRIRNADSLAAADDVLQPAAGAAADDDESNPGKGGIASDSEGESDDEGSDSGMESDDFTQEAAEEVAAEGEDQARRGSIAHTTDEGDEYYELTDENGDPTGQTTWTDPSVPAGEEEEDAEEQPEGEPAQQEDSSEAMVDAEESPAALEEEPAAEEAVVEDQSVEDDEVVEDDEEEDYSDDEFESGSPTKTKSRLTPALGAGEAVIGDAANGEEEAIEEEEATTAEATEVS